MLLEDIKKLFQKLLVSNDVHIQVDGSDIGVRIFDNGSKLSLTTAVYLGDNYIPKSVRHSLTKKLPFSVENEHIKTYFTIDESKFSIFLNYLGTLEQLNNESLRILLEDFSWIADEWRLYLDENDKNDLIYIHAK